MTTPETRERLILASTTITGIIVTIAFIGLFLTKSSSALTQLPRDAAWQLIEIAVLAITINILFHEAVDIKPPIKIGDFVKTLTKAFAPFLILVMAHHITESTPQWYLLIGFTPLFAALPQIRNLIPKK